MDILNWLFLKKQQLIKTEANNAKTDLVVLGAEVPFTQRGDGYQDYAMPLADAVAAGCTENNTLRTGIYDNTDWVIGYPVMIKTCTQVIDTPAFPTSTAINLQGWKITGSLELYTGNPGDVVYLGSVEYQNESFWPVMPWKTSGTVFTYNELNDAEMYSTLANGALMYDNDANDVTPVNIYVTVEYYPGGADVYLQYYATTSLTAELTNTVVSFEFEFLHDSADAPTFIYY